MPEGWIDIFMLLIPAKWKDNSWIVSRNPSQAKVSSLWFHGSSVQAFPYRMDFFKFKRKEGTDFGKTEEIHREWKNGGKNMGINQFLDTEPHPHRSISCVVILAGLWVLLIAIWNENCFCPRIQCIISAGGASQQALSNLLNVLSVVNLTKATYGCTLWNSNLDLKKRTS